MSNHSNNRGKAQRALAVVALSLYVMIVGTMTFLPVHGERALYDAVIRLHVVANSDSEQDQALKMVVRDAVLARASEHLTGCESRSEAEERLEQILPELELAAAQTLVKYGCEQPVRVVLGKEEYPTRNYESFSFPAGEYLSLRVLIGQGEGQNFWCVLFPPLCSSVASVTRERAEDEFIAVGLNKQQYGIITETSDAQYKIRFRLLEVLQPLLRKK